MQGKALLEHLHSRHNLSWQQIQQLLLDPEKNNWRLSFKYQIPPYVCNLVKQFCQVTTPDLQLLSFCSEQLKNEPLECDMRGDQEPGHTLIPLERKRSA